MTTVGRWSPNKVRKRILDGTWVTANEALGGMVLMTPTSIASTGTGNSSSIGTNGSVTFSSCATLSLNGVFTSEYDNYMVVLRYKNSLGGYEFQSRLRSSGTDSSGTNYTHQSIRADSTTVAGVRSSSATTARISSTGTPEAGLVIYLYGPYLAQPTAYRTATIDNISPVRIMDFAGTHSLSTSYDGLSIFSQFATETTTGLVSVYGLGG